MNTSNNKTASNYHFLTREDFINLLEQKDMELKSKDVELKSKNVELEQKNAEIKVNPSLTPTFAYFLQSPYFPRFSYGLCVLQILFFLYGECFKFNLSYICFACFEGLLHWHISMVSPNGFFPFVVTSFWVLIRRTISVQ